MSFQEVCNPSATCGAANRLVSHAARPAGARTVYLEGGCELFVDAAKQRGARSYERAFCSRSCCLLSGFTAALEFICGCA
jgi:hypothetical protein